MKKIITLLAIIVLSATFSCSNKTTSPNPKITGDLAGLPNWVIDPAVEDGIGGVGIARASKGGIKFQIPRAELDAKANIAATIRAEISRVTKNSLRSADINNNDDIEGFFAQATKEVVKDIPLSGIKRLAIFKANDGTLYIHMVLQDSDYAKFLADSEKTFEKRSKKLDVGRDNINKTQAATKGLFDELEKERD